MTYLILIYALAALSRNHLKMTNDVLQRILLIKLRLDWKKEDSKIGMRFRRFLIASLEPHYWRNHSNRGNRWKKIKTDHFNNQSPHFHSAVVENSVCIEFLNALCCYNTKFSLRNIGTKKYAWKIIFKNCNSSGNLHYFGHFANRTKAKTALIETALTGDSLF